MNKLSKVLLSILGGMDVFIKVATPIILVLLYLSVFGIKGHWSSYVFLIVGWCASLFRGIKLIWLRE